MSDLTLGTLAVEWIEAHCVVPDRGNGEPPLLLYSGQSRFFFNHYRVKPSARPGQLATAFVYRRSQWVRPQKYGKGPTTAAQVCLEAVGPCLFLAFAAGGEVYDCRDFGCGCGWVYEYEPGEPMGRPWGSGYDTPEPLIQITAYSEKQTDNIYDALRPMIDKGPLSDLIPKTGEEFIRLPNDGRIDVVTSNAQSRLGQRVTFVPHDESQLYTDTNGMTKVHRTQLRGLAGMGGRSVETTNAWDPAVDSVARRTHRSKAKDIYKDFVQPPEGLDFTKKKDRFRIYELVYEDALTTLGGHVDPESIDADAVEAIELDPGEAERFYGNRLVQGRGFWMPKALWEATLADRPAS